MSEIPEWSKWPQRAYAAMVAAGCEPDRARRIADSVAAQKAITVDDGYVLYAAVGATEMVDDAAA